MPDYFVNYCIVLKLQDAAAVKYALEFNELVGDLFKRFEFDGDEPPVPIDDDDQFPEDFPPSLIGQLSDWSFNIEAQYGGIYIESEYDGQGQYAICAFIQHLLQKFEPTGRVEFEWAFACSRHTTDAYGGGAAVITAQEIKTMTTSQWLYQQAEELKPK